jgi:hypothetical protein
MATPNPDLIAAFRRTISKLKNNTHYEWGHMGACNCGNLAQEITQLSKAEIHQYAMQKHGDWNEQLLEYCPTSGYPMDLMISKMIDAGLKVDELAHLERLSDPRVLQDIPMPRRIQLNKNNRVDVIIYLETWLHQLEQQWIKSAHLEIPTNSLKNIKEKILA